MPRPADPVRTDRPASVRHPAGEGTDRRRRGRRPCDRQRRIGDRCAASPVSRLPRRRSRATGAAPEPGPSTGALRKTPPRRVLLQTDQALPPHRRRVEKSLATFRASAALPCAMAGPILTKTRLAAAAPSVVPPGICIGDQSIAGRPAHVVPAGACPVALGAAPSAAGRPFAAGSTGCRRCLQGCHPASGRARQATTCTGAQPPPSLRRLHPPVRIPRASASPPDCSSKPFRRLLLFQAVTSALSAAAASSGRFRNATPRAHPGQTGALVCRVACAVSGPSGCRVPGPARRVARTCGLPTRRPGHRSGFARCLWTARRSGAFRRVNPLSVCIRPSRPPAGSPCAAAQPSPGLRPARRSRSRSGRPLSRHRLASGPRPPVRSPPGLLPALRTRPVPVARPLPPTWPLPVRAGAGAPIGASP